MGSKLDKIFFLGALLILLPTTPATTLEIWQNGNFVCKKIDFSETIFRNGNFSIIKGKRWWPYFGVFPAFLNNFHRCVSFGAVDYDIGKKAIFVRFRRFFIVATKIAVLGQTLPFSGYRLTF